MNTTTRKYSRTMQEAFGPYTDSSIYEPYQQTTGDAWFYASLAIIAAAFAVILFIWG